MTGKFIIAITGPAMTYRLDLIKKAFPSIIKDYLLIFTNSYSYNLYTDYHNDFNFVIMDHYLEKYSKVLDKEVFFDSPTQEHFFENVANFYSEKNGILYPYDAHRFILPYLAENNILNFVIIDSDFILNDSPKMMDFIFNRMPDSSMCNAWFGSDANSGRRVDFLNTYLKPLYPDIDFNIDSPRSADGYMRGFKFKNAEDIMLFFNMWNSSIEILLSNTDFKYLYGGNVIMDVAWLNPYIMQVFQKLGYSIVELNEFLDVDARRVGVHCTRPEDTFYYGKRSNWEEYNFDYSGINNISSFVYKNKDKLRTYYESKIEIIEITDTHVYNKVS
jgi:hypothetical protein